MRRRYKFSYHITKFRRKDDPRLWYFPSVKKWIDPDVPDRPRAGFRNFQRVRTMRKAERIAVGLLARMPNSEILVTRYSRKNGVRVATDFSFMNPGNRSEWEAEVKKNREAFRLAMQTKEQA